MKHSCEPVPWSVWVERALHDANQGGESHPLWPVQDVLRGIKSGGISISSTLSPPDTEVLYDAVKAKCVILDGLASLKPEKATLQKLLLNNETNLPIKYELTLQSIYFAAYNRN